MTNEIKNLIETYKVEHRRTKGKESVILYRGGWLIINGQKGIGLTKMNDRIAEMKNQPTVTDRIEMVNGVNTLIMAHQHVVQNLLSHKDVIEDRDTPLCCSVASELYHSM